MLNKEEQLRLDNQFCFQVYAASRMITKMYRPLLKKLELTYPQYLVMLVIWEHKQITVKDLGKKLLLDSGTLTPLLKRLENMGVVSRQRSSEDERLLLVSLTEGGKELKQKALDLDIPANMMNRCAFSFDERTLGNLREELKGLVSDLERASAKDKAK